jgi:CBS domain-containing protein
VIGLETVSSAADRSDATAIELAVLVPTLEPGQPLDTVIDLLLHSDVDGLPVTAPEGSITGWVSNRDVLVAYQRLLSGEPGSRRPDAGRGPAAMPAAFG